MSKIFGFLKDGILRNLMLKKKRSFKRPIEFMQPMRAECLGNCRFPNNLSTLADGILGCNLQVLLLFLTKIGVAPSAPPILPALFTSSFEKKSMRNPSYLRHTIFTLTVIYFCQSHSEKEWFQTFH